MKRVARLKPVVQVADLEAKKAARALARAQQRLGREQQTLQQLLDYQRESQQNLLRDGREGISVQRLRLASGFSASLDTAIERQTHQVDMVNRELEKLRAQWQQRDMRLRQLEKMVERIDSAERREQERQEQRNHDEYARYSSGRGGWD